MSKTFKYGHLYSLTSTTAPNGSSMIAGELALGLKSGEEKLWAYDGTNVIDLGKALGGVIGDEKTIHREVIASGADAGKKQFSTLLRMKKITSADTAEWAAIPANVKDRYKLVDVDGNNISYSGVSSEYIDIYKDSSIAEIYLGTEYDTVDSTTGEITKYQIDDVVDGHIIVEEDFQFLVYVYQNTSGQYAMTKINLRDFLVENEFESGVTVTNGIAHGVVDPTTEAGRDGNAFLTVGADGFKVDGIIDEIEKEISDLDATVSGVTSGNHITLIVEELDGKLVQSGFTFEENDIASQSLLDELSGKAVTEIASSNNSITTTASTNSDGTVEYDILTDASKIQMSGYVSSLDDVFAIVESLSVTDAIQKIEDSVEMDDVTGILFYEGSDDTVVLNAGTF